VDIIYPDFEVTKECLTDNADANEVTFLITIENTGDVPLDFTTDEPEIAPFSIDPGGVAMSMEVTREVPADATEVENTINVVATLPAEYICGDNPTTIEKSAEDTCDILQPDFTVTKECITPEVVAGEMATFLITITNTGATSLDFVTDEAEIGPFTLAAGGDLTQEVDRLATTNPVSNTINVTATTVNGTELGGSASDTCLVVTPDFEVVKNCLTDPVVADSNALFEIIVTNTGDIPLDFEIDDAPDAPFLVGPINPGGVWTATVERVPGDCGVDVVVSNTVIVTAFYGDGQELGTKEATADCPVPCVGEEGCTPGFWKNHPDCWCDAYTPTMLASDVFTALGDPNYAGYSDSKCDFDTDTLMDALKYGGGRGLEGSVRNLLRHATAALLNGCSGDVNYPVSDALVIDLVNAALETEDVDIVQELHGVLAGFNEDSPCPINAHCDVIPDDPE
jgi:archaellum component FlaG (FlaF/FlaG flagellin family)